MNNMLHKCVEHVIFIAMKKVYYSLLISSLIAVFNFAYGDSIDFTDLNTRGEFLMKATDKAKDDLNRSYLQIQNERQSENKDARREVDTKKDDEEKILDRNMHDRQDDFTRVDDRTEFFSREKREKLGERIENELKHQTKIIRETARAFRLTSRKKEELEKEIRETLHIQVSDFLGKTSNSLVDEFDNESFKEEFNKLQKRDDFKYLKDFEKREDKFRSDETKQDMYEKHIKDIDDKLLRGFSLNEAKESFTNKTFDKKIERRNKRKEIEEHIKDLTKEAQRDADLILKSTVKKEIPPNSIGIALGSSLEDLAREIERKTGLKIETGERSRQVVRRINKKAENMTKYIDFLPPKQWESLFADSDGDGVSDYDEIYVYKTDPNNPYTAGGKLTDGEKIALGLNVHSPEPEPAPVESPKYAGEVTPEVFEVTKIEKQPDKLKIEGSALPNSFVTLFVYSTPIVVTVKADDKGHWSYELKTELENGEHELYVATVNYAGKIVAKSPAVPFTLTAEAAYFEPLTVNIAEPSIVDIFKKYMFITSFLVALIFVLFILLFLGFKLSRKHTVSPSTL